MTDNVELIKSNDDVSLLYIKVKLEDMELMGMIDTGATLSAISEKVVKRPNFSGKVTNCSHNIVVADSRKSHISQEV